MIDRVSYLHALLQEDPRDEFTNYALALEMIKIGNKKKASELFTWLVNEKSNYVPTYYQFGKLAEKAGEIERASDIYARGIEAAVVVSDRKAENELAEAMSMLVTV